MKNTSPSCVNLHNHSIIITYFVLLLGFLTISFSAIGEDKDVVYIDHDISGRFYGETKITYSKKDNYIFRVIFDENYKFKQLTQRLDKILLTLSNLQDPKNNIIFDTDELKDFKKELFRMKDCLLLKNENILKRSEAYYKTAFEQYSINDYKSASECDCKIVGKYLPANEKDYSLLPELSVNIKYLRDDGRSLGICGDQTIKFEEEDCSLIAKAVSIPEETSKIIYEIRNKNSSYFEVRDWYEKHKLDTCIIEAIKIYKKNYEKIDLELDSAEKLLKEWPSTGVKRDAFSSIIKAESKLKLKCGGEFKKCLNNWLKKWLWLNNGAFTIDPLGSYFNSPSINKAEKKNLELELVEVNAKIRFFEKLISSGKSSINSNVNSQINNTENTDFEYSISEAAKWERRKAEIEKDLAGLNGGDDGHSDRSLYDDLLYQGQFYLSDIEFTNCIFKDYHPFCNRNYNFHRHHDALNDYLLMESEPVKEIEDGQRLYVMLHNLKPEQKVDVKYTFTELPSSPTLVEEELELNDLGEAMIPDSLQEPSITFAELFKIYQNIEFLKKISGITILPPKGNIDETPAYITKIKTHDLPAKMPNKVTYEIKEKNDEGEDTVLGTGEYRINKLFLLRWKAGMVYSTFNKTEYNFDNANNISVSEKQWGMDATFGIQSFFGRTDIRKPGFRMNPFAYVGIAIKDSPVENWYVGGGVEIINGLGVMAGAHIGKSQKLILDAGNPVVKEYYPSAWFYSIIIDTSVFKQLFQLNTIDNPFKSLD